MALGLGVDTGGTYTDAVVVDFETGNVLSKAKALTTKEDLSVGIRNAVNRLAFDPTQIRLISISTTLATNSIVEGKGGSVCLIAVGYDRRILYEYGLGRNFPVKEVRFLKGKHDLEGNEVAPLDLAEAERVIEETKDRIDAYAISSYLSVRNPEHEIKLRNLVRQHCDLPVVCGHDLSNELNSIKRAITVAFNARLIPVLDDLISSIKRVLQERGLYAPLMIVKGDGHLIGDEMARNVPIETILSGPAASIIGARHLSGIRNGLVVDIGGTTTDIAPVVDGEPSLNEQGARVAHWSSSVKAVDIKTSGFGGDSYIRVDRVGNLLTGPRRVIPLSLAASQFPEIKRTLRGALQNVHIDRLILRTDFFVKVKAGRGLLSEGDRRVMEVLHDGPKSLFQIAQALGLVHPLLLRSERLEELGLIQRIGLTPTDILHVQGVYRAWDVEAAELGLQIYARMLSASPSDLAARIRRAITRKLFVEILNRFMANGGSSEATPCPSCSELIDRALEDSDGDGFTCHVRLKDPIVAIGAPVEAYMPEVTEKLRTELVIPPDAEVANAVGAIMGSIIETVEVMVEPRYTPAGIVGYTLHAPTGRKAYRDLEEAVAQAVRIGENLAREKAEKAGAGRIELKVERGDRYGAVKEEYGDGIYLGTKVKTIAVGRPHLGR